MNDSEITHLKDYECIAEVMAEPRKSEFIRIFGSNVVPVVSPFPELSYDRNNKMHFFYHLDMKFLTSEMRERFVNHISEVFGYSTDDIMRRLDKVGIPIDANKVIIRVKNPFKWM